jgi:hypothetical protein
MSMLNKLHDWLDDKTCTELDDRQLGRKIQMAYREDEPVTPAADLFAQIRARAELNMQSKPDAKRVTQTAVKVQVSPTPPASAKPETQKPSFFSRFWHSDVENRTAGVYAQRSAVLYREQSRLMLTFTLNHMRANLFDAGIHML